MIREYDFETARERDRTFNIYDKLDDVHANGVHDYLKYLKFGYGRATDDASTDIRHGRMTRDRASSWCMKHDPKRPRDLDRCSTSSAPPRKSSKGWSSTCATSASGGATLPPANGSPRTAIGNHKNDPGVDAVRLPPREGGGFIMNSKNTLPDPHIMEGGGYNFLDRDMPFRPHHASHLSVCALAQPAPPRRRLEVRDSRLARAAFRAVRPYRLFTRDEWLLGTRSRVRPVDGAGVSSSPASTTAYRGECRAARVDLSRNLWQLLGMEFEALCLFVVDGGEGSRRQ